MAICTCVLSRKPAPGLQRLPLPTPLQLPLWLVLPAEWQEHPVLRHTARELGRLGNRQAEKYAPGA
jgi:hypothetical protein